MKKIYLLAAATLAIAACNNDDNYDNQPVAAQITATIGESAVARASDNQWAKGDRIGISMGTKYLNMEYTTDNGDGTFSGTTMYFPNKTEPVTLTAYYPYTGHEGESPVLEASTPAENQTPEKQADFDFLYSKLSDVTGSNPKVDFTFSHRMSKLTIIFKNGSGMDVSKITSCSIEGLILYGSFDTATGECTAKSDAGTKSLNINTANVKTEVALPSLIIFPQSLENKTVTLKITDSEKQDFACDLSFEGNRIMSGNNYQFTITVNKTGLTINKSSITDWTTKDSSANADPINPE